MTIEQIKREIASRPTSGFNVSIGTGIALERILEPVIISESKDVKPRVYVDTLVLDITTLIRNLLSSLDSDTIKSIASTPGELIIDTVGEFIRNEIYTIQHMIHVVLVKPKDTRSKYLKPIAADTITYKVRMIIAYIVDNIDIDKGKIRGTSILLTHNATTALDYPNNVLQSHTGNILPRDGLMTLLKPFGKDKCLDVKLNAAWILILGDKAGTVNLPILPSYRKRLKKEALLAYRSGKSIDRRYIVKFFSMHKNILLPSIKGILTNELSLLKGVI